MTSQLWLLLMLYGAAAAVSMLGYILMLHQTYDFWRDPCFLVVCAISRLWYAMMRAIATRVFRKLVQPALAPASGERGTWKV